MKKVLLFLTTFLLIFLLGYTNVDYKAITINNNYGFEDETKANRDPYKWPFNGWDDNATYYKTVLPEAEIVNTPEDLDYIEISGGLEITGFKDPSKFKKPTSVKLVIPDEINGKPVISIGRNAFEDTSLNDATTTEINAMIIDLVIGKNVNRIKYQAFKGQSINYLNIPGNVKKIDKQAFLSCETSYININDGVEELGDGSLCVSTLKCVLVIVPNSITKLVANVETGNLGDPNYKHESLPSGNNENNQYASPTIFFRGTKEEWDKKNFNIKEEEYIRQFHYDLGGNVRIDSNSGLVYEKIPDKNEWKVIQNLKINEKVAMLDEIDGMPVTTIAKRGLDFYRKAHYSIDSKKYITGISGQHLDIQAIKFSNNLKVIENEGLTSLRIYERAILNSGEYKFKPLSILYLPPTVEVLGDNLMGYADKNIRMSNINMIFIPKNAKFSAKSFAYNNKLCVEYINYGGTEQDWIDNTQSSDYNGKYMFFENYPYFNNEYAYSYIYKDNVKTGIAIDHVFNNSSIIEFPEYIDGLPVKTITENTFNFINKNIIEKIKLPNTVTNFTSIFNPKQFSKLREFIFSDNIKNIPDNMFNDTISELISNLEIVHLPENLVTIGAFAFTRCFKLKNINLSDSLERVGSSAFAMTGAIINKIPSNLKYIEQNAFGGCKILDKDIVLKEGFEQLESGAFFNVQNINSLILPTGYKIEQGFYIYNHNPIISNTNVFLSKGFTCNYDKPFENCEIYYEGTRQEFQSEIGYNNISSKSGTIHYNSKLANITFNVVNGTWQDNSFAPIKKTIILDENNNPINLEVPTGMIPNEGCSNGSWDIDPTTTPLTDGLTFTYKFIEPDRVVSHSITLKDIIGLNFEVKLTSTFNIDTDYILFTIPNGNKKIKVFIKDAKVLSNGLYKFTCPLPAKEMTDKIIAEMYINNEVKFTDSYSVLDYATYALSSTDPLFTPEIKELIRSMLNYGAAAQTYFNYNINNLANKNLTEDEKKVRSTTADLNGHDRVVTNNGTDGFIQYYSSSLNLKSALFIKHYFTLTEGASINDYKFEEGGKELSVYRVGEYYCVDIKPIYANNISNNFTLTVTNTKTNNTFTVKYDPYTYGLNHVKDEKELNVILAMADYCKASNNIK